MRQIQIIRDFDQFIPNINQSLPNSDSITTKEVVQGILHSVSEL